MKRIILLFDGTCNDEDSRTSITYLKNAIPEMDKDAARDR